MYSVTIYYDDKSVCREYIEAFSRYDGITCKRAEDYQEIPFIFEENDNVGFLFESTKEKIPPAVRYVMERLVMNKNGRCFVAVIGGRREIAALRESGTELKKRGYKVKNIYSQYMFEKYHLDIESAVKKMTDDVENEQNNLELHREWAQEQTAKQMRRYLRRELKQYKNYKKKNRKKGGNR